MEKKKVRQFVVRFCQFYGYYKELYNDCESIFPLNWYFVDYAPGIVPEYSGLCDQYSSICQQWPQLTCRQEALFFLKISAGPKRNDLLAANKL